MKIQGIKNKIKQNKTKQYNQNPEFVYEITLVLLKSHI